MATKGRILIVDDDPDFVKTTKMILLADGYEVVVAEDGRQGLEKIKDSQPQLILLDIMMESMFEGFSLLSVLRTAPEFEDLKATPVIMVSSVKTDTGSRFFLGDDEEMGDAPQPDNYMDKPVEAETTVGEGRVPHPKMSWTRHFGSLFASPDFDSHALKSKPQAKLDLLFLASTEAHRAKFQSTKFTIRNLDCRNEDESGPSQGACHRR